MNKKTKQSITAHKMSPIKKPKLMISSDTNQYENLMFIGVPDIATKINIYKFSRFLNIGTTPIITNIDITQTTKTHQILVIIKTTDKIAGTAPNVS